MNYSSIVQAIYSAFGQGDVPTILDNLSENVDWEYGADNSPIPWLQHGQGHTAAKAFFSALNALDFHKFIPKAVCETSNIVVALIDLEATLKRQESLFRKKTKFISGILMRQGRLHGFATAQTHYSTFWQINNDAPKTAGSFRVSMPHFQSDVNLRPVVQPAMLFCPDKNRC